MKTAVLLTVFALSSSVAMAADGVRGLMQEHDAQVERCMAPTPTRATACRHVDELADRLQARGYRLHYDDASGPVWVFSPSERPMPSGNGHRIAD